MELSDLSPILPLIFKPGLIIGAVITLSIMLSAWFRSRHFPECFSCGAFKVRPARPRTFADRIAAVAFIRPFRCEGCRERYYALRLISPNKRQGVERGLKITVQTQYGLPSRVVIRVISLQPVRAKRKPDHLSGSPAILHS